MKSQAKYQEWVICLANLVKRYDELLLISKAQSMGDICFEHMLDYIKPGMTEIEIADEIVVVANGYVRAAGDRKVILPALLDDERAARCPWGKEGEMV